MEYAYGTSLESESGPFACGLVSARAMCADGTVRSVRFANGGIADTFFSVPGRVSVAGRTVSGYVTVSTADGYSTVTDDDPPVVKFRAYQYGKNADALPAGEWVRSNREGWARCMSTSSLMRLARPLTPCHCAPTGAIASTRGTSTRGGTERIRQERVYLLDPVAIDRDAYYAAQA
jgi:hypothetical protein